MTNIDPVHDHSKPPERTNEMKELSQVWVWINIHGEGPHHGRWEVRGTGLKMDWP